ncbi:hypothetical protein ACSLN1_26215, partial [Escherichia coli]|uniref:hypothetical protein n=1 Tax=Escherichia coli TaxID=562 RepID=UPI003EE05949
TQAFIHCQKWALYFLNGFGYSTQYRTGTFPAGCDLLFDNRCFSKMRFSRFVLLYLHQKLPIGFEL